MAKNPINITPQYKLPSGSWTDIPSFVTQITTNRQQKTIVYYPLNSSLPTVINAMASPIWTWEVSGVCTSTTDFRVVEEELAPGTQASFKCSTATPGVRVIVTGLDWDERGGLVNIYRYRLRLQRA